MEVQRQVKPSNYLPTKGSKNMKLEVLIPLAAVVISVLTFLHLRREARRKRRAELVRRKQQMFKEILEIQRLLTDLQSKMSTIMHLKGYHPGVNKTFDKTRMFIQGMLVDLEPTLQKFSDPEPTDERTLEKLEAMCVGMKSNVLLYKNEAMKFL